ncbi:MAG: MFS transporter [Nanoarchaeota archaeon]|nr:MFS transporter [Nanoarchaeota archaeon]
MKANFSKRRNVQALLRGLFFSSFSVAILSFFLPLFLKERGLTALQIGGLFSVGVAVGTFLFAFVFSRMLRRIKLRQGLVSSAILNFVQIFSVFIFPSSGGALLSKITNVPQKQISSISIDSTMQHNVVKGKEREGSISWGLSDSFGLIFGIIIAMISINYLGFLSSFFIFSMISLSSLFFYSKVNDDTRFKPKRSVSKKAPLSTRIKLLIFTEVIYWFVLSASFALVVTFLVSDKLSGGIFELGILFVILYVFMNVGLYFTKYRLRNFHDSILSIFGMLFLLISAVIVVLSNNLYIVVIAFIFEGLGAGIWVPAKTSLQWKNTKKENREIVAGYLSGWRGFVQALGPLAGGFLITRFNVNYPFYLKIFISLICLGVYLYIWRKWK